MISEVFINQINNEYNFNCKVFPNTVFITSKYGSWICEEIKEGLFKLKHKNYKFKKIHSHIRHSGTFEDIRSIFRNIKTHDNYILKRRYGINQYDIKTYLEN